MEKIETPEIVPGDFIVEWRGPMNQPLAFMTKKIGLVLSVTSRTPHAAIRMTLLQGSEVSDELIVAREWYAIVERCAS